MRAGPLALSALIVIVFQTSVMPLFSTAGGAHPDLVLVLAVVSALADRRGAGWKIGLVMGAAQDLVSARYLGLFAGTRALAGYVTGLVERRFFRGRVVLPFTLCLASTWLAEGAAFLLLYMTGLKLAYEEIFLEVIGPASIMNGILGVIVYGPWIWVLNRYILSDRG